MSPTMQTLEQQRAAHAQRAIERKKISAACAKKAPGLVLQNGLLQAVAFWEEKQGDWTPLLKATTNWLTCSSPVRGLLGGSNQNESNLLDRLLELESHPYRVVTREALAYLNWVKRLAAARADESNARKEARE